ncbi:MAG: group 1 truncated hemoglobin [Pelagibacteraceae bacterium]|nr:group 1 truncated hemoglobin [Pelagibacteraceae bacterium]MCI5079671.1 group 1 truncated hemoglobin [Pelagibacteraceae bacterium]
MINLKQHYPVSAIYDLVERLYFELKKHKEFYEKFFKGIKLEKLIQLQKETFAYLFGYTDKNPNINLYESHKHLNIKDEDWFEFVQILTKVLKDAKLPEDHIQHILEKVSSYKDEIIKKD